jgi:hypothetical protein
VAARGTRAAARARMRRIGVLVGQGEDDLDRDHDRIKQLMLFFGLVYIVEGIGQHGGIISQPLRYYLKEVYAWTPLQVTAFFTAFDFPWIIKPICGLLSDFVPLLGYRRKSYFS